MILCRAEHRIPANNLATVLREPVADPAEVTAGRIPACRDATLTVLGRGGADSFGGMTAAQVAVLVRAWKEVNPALTAVEIVACNALRALDQADAFTDRLMQALRAAPAVPVIVKALPRGGSTATCSALWLADEPGSDGYCFITADDGAALDAGSRLFKDAFAALAANTPIGRKVTDAAAVALTAKARAALQTPQKYVLSGAPFAKLRRILVPVSAFRDADGVLKAVPRR
jgi:hypothetical protein